MQYDVFLAIRAKIRLRPIALRLHLIGLELAILSTVWEGNEFAAWFLDVQDKTRYWTEMSDKAYVRAVAAF